MKCFKDTTFCASPNCKNECGRKMTEAEEQEANQCDADISWAYFCGEPE